MLEKIQLFVNEHFTIVGVVVVAALGFLGYKAYGGGHKKRF